MDYYIAIPSYKRPDVLKTKTMALLERHNIDKEKIHIFVSDTEQEIIYRSVFPDYRIIVGCPGLCAIRNFITLFFPQNTPLVCMDDDLQELFYLRDDKLDKLKNLHSLLYNAFVMCVENSRNMWGIYPVRNGFWMSPGATKDYKFCIGHMYGVINKQEHIISLDYKEDYERTLQYCVADGGVIRINSVCALTKMGAKGGMDTAVKARMDKNKESCSYLLKKYPMCVRLNTRREGEVLLRNPKLV